VALNNLAWLLFEGKRGAPAEALELARRAHAAAPSSAQIMDTLGWILFSIGRRDEALPMLEQAAKLAPANEQVVGHLAEAKRSAGSPAGG
jgi:Flp pilus assembly protein TadD